MRVAREGLPIVAGALLATVAAWFLHPLAALPAALFALFSLWFFRDPERTAPDEPGALISPADGKIIQAGPRVISIFMNVFDVHVCRAPTAGTIQVVDHMRGRFMAAFKDAAPEHNERTAIVLERGSRRLRFTLIAGLIARRIVCRVEPGQSLSSGQRVGVIRFGSRVDVELPADQRPAVRVGQRVLAGQTVIARPESRA